MRAAWWFRAASVMLLLFAAGHTYGFLKFRPSSADGLAVWNSMNQVHFQLGSTLHTYGEFYLGFGLFITAFYLFVAWLAWSMGSMARRSSVETVGLAFGMLLLQLLSLGLALRYFGAGPAVLSAAASLCLLFGILSARRSIAPAGADVQAPSLVRLDG